MALILNDEQQMLRDTARAFLAENAPVSALRALRDDADPTGYSAALWKRFAEMGFSGVLIDEAHGGLGLGHVEAGLVMEEIGRNLSASPFLAASVVGATLIGRTGTPAQQQAWLPGIAAAERVVTLAVDERSKHDPAAIATTALRSADGWTITGDKTFVLDGHVADAFVVAARSPVDANGVVLLLVPRDAAGVTVERTAMVDAHNASRVRFAGTRVGADAVVADAGAGQAALEIALDAGRLAAAAELLGVANEAFDRTVKYLTERKQFGKFIGEFQALQHRAAHLYSEIEITRAAVMKAQQVFDDDPTRAAAAVSVAKARAGSTATLAVQEGVQMHGGIGMTDAFEIGFFMKRARVLQELWGDANHHADRFARLRGY